MIRIERSLLRRFRTALRKSLGASARNHADLPVTIRSSSEGRVLLAGTNNLVLAWQDAVPGGDEVVALPFGVLAELEGMRGDVVLERVDQGMIARWHEQGIPKQQHTACSSASHELPLCLGEVRDPGPGFLDALAEAVECTAKEGVRYALHKVQLRGADGIIVASDGRQLLHHGGFRFLWTDHLLIPSLAIFSWPEWRTARVVSLGCSESHLWFQVGSWTLGLVPDRTSRFPSTDGIFPRPHAIVSRLRIDPLDADFLERALPHLPQGDRETAAVTLELNDAVRVRARAGSGPGTVVELARSSLEGEPRQIATSRHYLARAMRLGLRDLAFVNDEAPILGTGGARRYLWMPLAKLVLKQAKALGVKAGSARAGR